MADGHNSDHLDDQTSARLQTHEMSFSRASPQDADVSHGYFNPAPASHMEPRDQGHGGPPTTPFPTSHTPSNGRLHGEPSGADVYSHPMAAPSNFMMPSHLPSPTSPAYSEAFRQRYDEAPTNSSPTHDWSRYPGDHSSHSRAPDQRGSYSPHMAHHRDRSPDRATTTVASPKHKGSVDVIEGGNNAEEVPGDGSVFLRAIALAARSFGGFQEEGRDVQHFVDQQMANQETALGQDMLDQTDSVQKAVQQPAVQDPAVQKSFLHQPEANELQNEESTSSASLSELSTVSDCGEQAQYVSDQEVNDNSQRREMTPQSEAGVGMVEKYAFNFLREGYNHRIPQQVTSGITIHVGSLAALTTSLKQYREETEHKSAIADQDAIPPQIPHPNEFQKDLKTIECVWVGMLPSPAALLQIKSDIVEAASEAAGEGSSKKPAQKRVKKSTTVADMRDDEMKIIDFDRNALRVVAKKSDKLTRDTHIYALLNPNSTTKRCQGFKVGFDDVFYFRDFRDDTTKSAMPRKQATIAKIRASVFPVDAPAASVSQSPVPTNGGSSIRELSTIASSSSAPGVPAFGFPVVVSQSRSPPSQAAPSHPSSSKDSSRKASREQEATPRKRKARNPIVETMMKQRGEARKKARFEGYSVPSDSNLPEGVETDGSGAPAGRIEDSDGDLLDLASEYFADVDEPVDLDSSATGRMPREHGFEGNVDDGAYPEHAVGARVPELRKHTDDLIRELARVDEFTPKAPKSVACRDKDGQLIEKNSKMVKSNIGPDRDGYGNDDEGQSSGATDKESASLIQKITALANELATSQDVVGLQQALAMVQSVQNRRGPPKTSPLGLYFNVPTTKDIPMEDCAEKLRQLRAFFPGMDDDHEIHDHMLAWMSKGLQLTGQSISIDLLSPFLISFAEEYRSKFGSRPDSQTRRISRDVLVDMICVSRDEAEEIRRFTAVWKGADRASLEAEGKCSSHPYIDPDEEIVYQSAMWEPVRD